MSAPCENNIKQQLMRAACSITSTSATTKNLLLPHRLPLNALYIAENNSEGTNIKRDATARSPMREESNGLSANVAATAAAPVVSPMHRAAVLMELRRCVCPFLSAFAVLLLTTKGMPLVIKVNSAINTEDAT